MKSTLFKITIMVILICLFIGCLQNMPYSYYQIVRFVSFAGFIILAYLDYKDRHYIAMPLSIAGLILFNPLFKVYLKRPVWQRIDEAIAYILAGWIVLEVAYCIYEKRKGKDKSL